MTSSDPGQPRRWSTTAATGAMVVYAWWATGLVPFTGRAYLAVALPSLVLIVAYGLVGGWGGTGSAVAGYYRQRTGEATLADAVPWLVILFAGLTVEAVGLLLGGRSPIVPTLSTTVDHLLVTHVGRFALFAIWLLIGFSAVDRLLTARRVGGR